MFVDIRLISAHCKCLLAGLTLLLSFASNVQAGTEQYFLEGPPKLVKGVYVGADFGAMFFQGIQGTDYQTGPMFGVKLGSDLYDIGPFTSAVEVTGRFSAHDSSYFGTAGTVSSFLLAMGDLKLKLGMHLHRRVVLNVYGGAGYLISDPPFSASGDRNRVYFPAGAGVEYYMHIRHLSAYLNPAVVIIDQLTGYGIFGTGGIKYTW